MSYRKLIYVTTVKFKDGKQRKYATFTIKDISDRLRLIYNIELNKSRVFDELPAPSEIYNERTATHKIEIYKLVCA